MRLSYPFLIKATLLGLTFILAAVIFMALVNFGDSNDKQNPGTSNPGLNTTTSPVPRAAETPLKPGATDTVSPTRTSPKGRVDVQSLPPATTPSTPQEAPAPRQILPTSTPKQKEVIPLVTQPPPTTPTT